MGPLSIVDTLGTTKNILVSEVSDSFNCTQLYVAVTQDSVLIKKVSLFIGILMDGVNFTAYCS